MRTEVPANWVRSAEQLKLEIISSLPTGSLVNLSVPTHVALTLALHDLAFSSAQLGQRLKITYRDLSRPLTFPLGTLQGNVLNPALEKMHPLCFGLLSHRHPEMDFVVDAYLNTNLEKSSAISMADEDDISYRNALNWFSNVASTQPLVAYVIQTGLEPIVVGFYRALAEMLAPGKPQRQNLVIMPCILRPDLARDSNSEVITPQTPGAKLDDYIVLPAWY